MSRNTMTQMDKIPYELIAGYLGGECSPEDEAELLAWVDDTQENKKIFAQMSQEWAAASSYKQYGDVKADVLSRLEREAKSSGHRPHILYGAAARIAGIAAAVVLIAVTAFMMVKLDGAEKLYASQLITVKTMPGQKSELVLPDGTHIWLNSESEVSYSADYNVGGRRVRLNRGEAFFDVAKSEGSGFVLDAGELGVKVYGTKFNVRRYEDDPAVDVTLEEGHIDVLSPAGEKWTEMFPGQKFSLDKTTGGKSLVMCAAEMDGVWRLGELVIKQASFDNVLRLMERWYGVRITVFGECDAERKFWMTIKTESLREMLDKLQRLVPLRYDIDGERVTLKFN